MTHSVESESKPLPITGGGRHRPFWKLTDDKLLRHGIRRERQERRRNLNRKAFKGIIGAVTQETPPYPPLTLSEKPRQPGQPVGRSGAQKRRARATLKQPQANPQREAERST